jgi:hypothetical protein
LPGFYSAEQVVNLLEKIEDQPKVSMEVIQEIENRIVKIIVDQDNQGNLVEEDDIQLEFSHNGREVEISNINIDFDVIRDAISEVLTSTFPEAPSEE